MSKLFYVTMTWDNWPEGGSYGTIVKAEDDDDAEAQARYEMAQSRLEDEAEDDYCGNCFNTDMDGSGACPDCGGTNWQNDGPTAEGLVQSYEDEWHVVDCYEVEKQMEIFRNALTQA